MASLNKATLIGYLGNKPEIRSLPNGDLVATLSLATSESWTDKNTGERREITEWHRVVFYRRLAEICERYLVKGTLIYLEGKIKTRKWQDKNGQEHYTTEIHGESLQMLSNKEINQSLPNKNVQKNHTARGQGESLQTEPSTYERNDVSSCDEQMPF